VGREVKINPFDLYVAQDQQNWSYATLITGVPPELIIYDANGTQMKEVSFDLNDPEIENAIASSITSLGQVEKPVVEKILLSEYLNGENNSWRPLDLSDGFNLRNQHQNEAEKNRIDNSPQLTRDRAKELLVKNYGVQATALKSDNAQSAYVPQATQKPKPPSVSLEKNKSKSTFFWIWVGAVAIIISVIVLLMA